MKTKYIGAVVMLALFGFVQPSSAEGSSWGVPAGETMRATVGLDVSGFAYSVCYDFTFRLSEDSDGVYPAAEVVEIEVPGELNPDGSESSAFVISIPIGSFQEGPSGFFYTWNPPGLKVSQHYKSHVWDFVRLDDPYSYPGRDAFGVKSLWGFIHQRDVGEGVSMRIRMQMGDTRLREERLEPSFFELLYGAPTLKIGNDGWKSYLILYRPHRFVEGPCSNFLTATHHD